MVHYLKYLFICLVFSASAIYAKAELIIHKVKSLETSVVKIHTDNKLFTNIGRAYQWRLLTDSIFSFSSSSVTTAKGLKIAAINKMLNNNKNCYLLMADTSGSMKNYWTDVKTSLSNWVDVANDKVAVYGFAENLYEISPVTANLDKTTTKQKIEQLQLKGKDTQLFLAIVHALKAVKKCDAVQKHLVIFSDGDAEDKAYTLNEVVKLANEQHVNIHTIGFGDLSVGKTSVKLQQLEALSTKTNSSYVYFNKTDNFKNIVINILKTHDLIGVIDVEKNKIPYGENELILTINVTDNNGNKHKFSKMFLISNTDSFDNMLVWLSYKFGGANPWVVIGVAVAILLLFILLLIINKQKKKNKYKKEQQLKIKAEKEKELIKIKAEKEKELRMQDAIKAIDEKIEAFQPDKAVSEKGEPYGFLKDEKGQYHQLVKYSSLIGRSESSDVVLNDQYVSNQHAILDFKKGEFIWTDRVPLNPTKLNDKKIEGNAIIKPGDIIVCGRTKLEFLLV